MKPPHAVHLRVGLDVTLEVHVIPLLDVTHDQVLPRVELQPWGVWGETGGGGGVSWCCGQVVMR